MAMITWLGEDDLHPDRNGPRHNEWRGAVFKIGEAVDISDPHMIAKARTNRFYSVSGGDPEPDEPAKRGPGRPRKEDGGPSVSQ